MSNKTGFDLFQLHQKEDKYRSMSYIIVKGKKLGEIVINLLWNIIKKQGLNKKILLRRISNKIGLSYFTLERQVVKLKNYEYWVSLAFLIELIKEYNLCFSNKSVKDIKALLINSFEKIKISNGKSLELNCVKRLSPELCTLAGAHAADGCLYKKKIRPYYHYHVLIVDRDYKTIEWYQNCLYNVFGLKTKIYKLKGCWIIHISNKIIFRYLNLFFGFPIGKKSSIVNEPKIIKRSSFARRKAFVKGVMTFDGSVTTFGAITLGIKSEPLINSIQDIFEKDGIEIRKSSNKNNDIWYLNTSSRLDKRQLNKWLNYFIEGTEKHKKVYELINGFQIKPKTLKEATRALNLHFPRANKSKINISDVLDIMISNKKLFVWEIADKLIQEKKLDSLSYTPIKMYLYVLEKQAKIIKSEDKMVRFNRSAAKSKLYSLNSFSKWRIP